MTFYAAPRILLVQISFLVLSQKPFVRFCCRRHYTESPPQYKRVPLLSSQKVLKSYDCRRQNSFHLSNISCLFFVFLIPRIDSSTWYCVPKCFNWRFTLANAWSPRCEAGYSINVVCEPQICFCRICFPL